MEDNCFYFSCDYCDWEELEQLRQEAALNLWAQRENIINDNTV